MEKKKFQIRFTALILIAVFFTFQNLQAKAYHSDLSVEPDNPTTEVIDITKAELLKMGQVSFNPEDSEFSSAFRVMSFTVSTKIGDYEESYKQTNGPRFTPQQINLIKKVKSKSKVYIENIIAIGPEGESRNLGSIVFKIK